MKAATACGKGYVCLTAEGKPCCRPLEMMQGSGESAALIECPADSGCSYCHSFGDTHICQCPVRLEIFTRYGE